MASIGLRFSSKSVQFGGILPPKFWSRQFRKMCPGLGVGLSVICIQGGYFLSSEKILIFYFLYIQEGFGFELGRPMIKVQKSFSTSETSGTLQ